MANSKQNFLGLVKVTGSIANYSNIVDKTGKLIFAQVTDNGVTKYIINANGIEYNIATAEVFNALAARVKSLEDWKGIVDTSIAELVAKDAEIDKSIAALDASVKNHETRIGALEDASAALAERIADVSKHANDNDASIVALKAKDTEIDASIDNISTRLSNIGITAANNKLTVNGKDVALSGSNYITVTAADNSVNVSLNAAKIQDGGSADGHENLATKGYVDDQIAVLEQALVFIGDISAGNVTEKLTDTEVKAGYTYVAIGAGEYDGQKFEVGDLIIVKEDAKAGTSAKIIVVERNLDGAVTAGAPLDSNKLVVGTGAQGVKTIDVTAEGLATAIANANSAIQVVKAADTQNDYVKISVENSTDPSTKVVSAILTVVDTSAALDGVTSTGSLVDAKAVKDLVDTKAADIKVRATLNSSTPEYVTTSASVDEKGRVISASVGVKTATLAEASTGGADFKALADARDVYNELTAVEQTMAAANTTMSNTIGLNSDYSVTWSTASGISADTTIVAAIEEVAKKTDEAKQSGVTEFGGKTGAISIDTTNTTDGSIKFAMDGSTLKGSVNGWSGLVDRVAAAETSISNVSTRVNEVSTRLDDLSTYVRKTVDASIDALQAKDVEIDASIDALQAKDTEIDASIDRLDASVSALETELAKHTVKSIEGEAGITTRANDEYVAVSASEPDAAGKVTIDSSVQLAENVDLTSIGATAATATGLATDATVKDYVTYALAWDVIG